MALANLDVMAKEDLPGRVQSLEGEFRASLDTLTDLPIVAEVRGMGYFYGIELTRNGADFTDDECEWLIRGFLSKRLLELGLICRADDRGDPVIQLSPSLVAGPDEFDAISSTLHQVLLEAWKELETVTPSPWASPRRSRRTSAASRSRPTASGRWSRTASRCSCSRARAWAPASPTTPTPTRVPRSSPTAEDVGACADGGQGQGAAGLRVRHLRPDLTLFTYLHLAAYPKVAQALCDAGTTGIAYETVMRADGALPLLAPMSEVAGRLAVQAGARFLEAPQGGRGVLLGGAPGVQPARVVVIGAGNVGWNSAWIAAGMEAEVNLLDKNLDRLRFVDQIHKGRITTLASNRGTVERCIAEADLVIGAVLVAGGRAPVVITESMVATMKPGAVIVDVAIDQGGCVETSRETTHHDPVYVQARRRALLRRATCRVPCRPRPPTP